jgi:hypothetical protein
VGRFHNFELTQNKEKTNNGFIFGKYLNIGHVDSGD